MNNYPLRVDRMLSVHGVHLNFRCLKQTEALGLYTFFLITNRVYSVLVWGESSARLPEPLEGLASQNHFYNPRKRALTSAVIRNAGRVK